MMGIASFHRIISSFIVFHSRYNGVTRSKKAELFRFFRIRVTVGGMFCQQAKQPRRGRRPRLCDGTNESCGPHDEAAAMFRQQAKPRGGVGKYLRSLA